MNEAEGTRRLPVCICLSGSTGQYKSQLIHPSAPQKLGAISLVISKLLENVMGLSPKIGGWQQPCLHLRIMSQMEMQNSSYFSVQPITTGYIWFHRVLYQKNFG